MPVNYETAISELISQGKFYINLGLERISKILELLDNPQNAIKCIHVAGTNGKGSVCAMLSSVLSQKYKTGLFTSPHVFEYTERIKINDEQISKTDFAKYSEKILKIADRNNIHLTEFEILTTMAFCYFAEKKVDIAVMEVGLGGRLDATNVISRPLCSVITHIDLDHTERLGDSIEDIAFEKGGIIKENCPVVVSQYNQGYEIIKQLAYSKNANLKIVCGQEKNYETALKGEFQKENLKLVLKVLEILPLNITEDDIIKGLKSVKHICRFEYLKEYNIIIDGAHNPNGTELLRQSLENFYPNQSYRFIFGCLKNKNYPQMLKNLFKPKDELYFYEFSNPNATKKEEIMKIFPYEIKEFSSYEFDKTSLTVICGSFYMIKEVLDKLGIKYL